MADTQFELESDSPAKPDLMFWQLAGVESFSRPSRYMLTVLSRKRQINPDDVLGKSFTVKMEFHDEGGGAHKRQYQGYATRLRRVGDANERLCMYQIELDSWFALLQHRTNARIFQDKKPDEVIKDVVQDSSIRTVENIDYAGLRETHEPRRYCVQYMESDFDFLSRLMEHEGVYYWFDNAGSGDGKKMMLADNVSVHEKLPVESELAYVVESTTGEARFNEIEEWWSERAVQTGRMELADRDFKKIRSKIGHKVDFAAPHDHADYEVFEFPGGFFDKDGAQRTADLRADERIARNEGCWAGTRWPDVAVGRVFQLSGHTDEAMNQEWLIARCLLVLSHPGYEGVTVDTRAHDVLVAQFFAQAMAPLGVWAGIDRKLDAYTRTRVNHAYLIEVAPANATYRPPRITPRLQMGSPHTAIVVGPAGEEIHMDEFGRVKVQFHWDRYGKADEKSTAWIRVSQPWAGQTWGGQFIPRIGQEVIVDFLYGDPDRPIIVGRVYNDDQPIPYTSPTQSGFKSRSTPGGGPANYNEIMFEDKKGQELLKFHAEKNMGTTVENDQATTVWHDQTLDVKNNRTVVIDGIEKYTVKKEQINHVIRNQTNHYDAHTFTTTKGNQTLGTIGEMTNIVNGSIKEHSNASINVSAVAGYSLTAQTLTVGIASDTKLTSGGSTTIGSVGAIDIKSNAARTDASVGVHSILANGIKQISNTNIDLTAVANINSTSIGNNTTVLGANASGYIGVNSEANLGMARSTFMGIQVDTMLGLSSNTCLAIQIEAAVAVKMGFAGVDLSIAPVDVEQKAFKVIMPGGGAAGGAGAAVMGASIGAAIGAVGVSALAAYTDVQATQQQYRDAVLALEEAAVQADAQNLEGLSTRLRAAKAIAAARGEEGSWSAAHIHSANADSAASLAGAENPAAAANNTSPVGDPPAAPAAQPMPGPPPAGA